MNKSKITTCIIDREILREVKLFILSKENEKLGYKYQHEVINRAVELFLKSPRRKKG